MSSDVLHKLGVWKSDYESRLVSSSHDLQNAWLLDGAFDVYELTRNKQSNSIVKWVRSNDVVVHVCACGPRVWNFNSDEHFGTSAEIQLAVFVRAKAISDLIWKVRTQDGVDMLFSLFDQKNTRLWAYSWGELEVMDDRLVEWWQTSTLWAIYETDSGEWVLDYVINKWQDEKRYRIYSGI